MRELDYVKALSDDPNNPSPIINYGQALAILLLLHAVEVQGGELGRVASKLRLHLARHMPHAIEWYV